MNYKEIFKTIIGSRAYGTNIETSDWDYKGIYVQSEREILGLSYVEQIDFNKDYVSYEIRRFIELLSSANPTVLEMLFVTDDLIIINSESFKILQHNKKKFLTKKCEKSFGGYAVAQIQKARGFK